MSEFYRTTDSISVNIAYTIYGASLCLDTFNSACTAVANYEFIQLYLNLFICLFVS